MRIRTRLFAVPFLASLVLGCSETPPPAAATPATPTEGAQAKGPTGARKPKVIGAAQGPEGIAP